MGWHGAPRLSGRARGVPPGGAFDQRSLALANVLVGNEETAPALEFAGDRLTLQATGGVLQIAVVGADVADDRFPGRVSMSDGEILDLSLNGSGARIIVATAGGSLETGQSVAVGDVINCGESPDLNSARLADRLPWIHQPQIRYIPESAGGQQAALTVSQQVSRQGLRLNGDLPGMASLDFSEPSVVGLIQVTPDGTALIHGPDGPTIGGYGRLGTVISADIPAIAQLKPGDNVDLIPVDLEFANRAWREACENLAQQLTRLKLSNGLKR